MKMTGLHRRMALKCANDRPDSRRVRHAIAKHCEDRLDPDMITDVQFVASELVTNAFEHGKRGVITVDVLLAEDGAVVTVTSSGNSRGIPHPVDWELPDEVNVCGRGLALTRKMSTHVELQTSFDSGTGEWVSVTAHIGRRDDRTPASVAA